MAPTEVQLATEQQIKDHSDDKEVQVKEGQKVARAVEQNGLVVTRSSDGARDETEKHRTQHHSKNGHICKDINNSSNAKTDENDNYANGGEKIVVVGNGMEGNDGIFVVEGHTLTPAVVIKEDKPKVCIKRTAFQQGHMNHTGYTSNKWTTFQLSTAYIL